MHRDVYNSRAWRRLPRDYCLVELLFGPAVGPCRGRIHRHHVDPEDPYSRTVPACASHHPKLEAALRYLRAGSEPRRCTHRHLYPGAREECERRMNRELATAIP